MTVWEQSQPVSPTPVRQGARSALRRRPLLVALVALVILAILFSAATAKLFVWPTSDRPGRADAVVVLAGAGKERLDAGLSLVEHGAAPLLAISDGAITHSDRNIARCGQVQRFRIMCFAPSPQSTRGEAEAIGRIARVHGWQRVIVVTSTYHVTRARLLVKRCFGGRLALVAAHPRDSTVRWWRQRILHEWAGWIAAQLHRSC